MWAANKIVSDAGTDWSNGQAEAGIKFVENHENCMKLMLTYICLHYR